MFCNLVLYAVVPNTVVKHKFSVNNKFLHVVVHVKRQLLLNRSEVHWVFDNLKIVIDAILARIDRIVEIVSSLRFPADRQHLLCDLDPSLLGLDLFYIRKINLFWVAQKFL